jgi:hypothetical protein
LVVTILAGFTITGGGPNVPTGAINGLCAVEHALLKRLIVAIDLV